jgi:hypothetical protein
VNQLEYTEELTKGSISVPGYKYWYTSYSIGLPGLLYCCKRFRVYSKIFPVRSIGASIVMNRKVHSKNIHLTGSLENST